jgi:hypothetical protein
MELVYLPNTLPNTLRFRTQEFMSINPNTNGPVGGSMRLRLQWAVAMRCALSSLNLTEIRIARAGSMGQRPAQQRHGSPLGDVRRGLRSGMP